MLKETNTPTRPRIEPGSPDPESDALTIRPVSPPGERVNDSKCPEAKRGGSNVICFYDDALTELVNHYANRTLIVSCTRNCT